MLFYYDIYSIDIDEVDCLYWAGYLGIAPKNQTKSLNGSTIDYNGFSQTENYNYTWSSNGVTMMVVERFILYPNLFIAKHTIKPKSQPTHYKQMDSWLFQF